MTTWLECSECNERFEVSNAIAEAMHRWREESGDPFLCVDCATHIAWGAAIVAMDGEHAGNPLEENPLPVGASSARDS
ncbi:hypothetical protein C6503_19400 [Candidatus Poribacteria bacterium]|nr:MAG: hypothetical protein C6503_19400 [Candidatus Poribacteria bacterium]